MLSQAVATPLRDISTWRLFERFLLRLLEEYTLEELAVVSDLNV